MRPRAGGAGGTEDQGHRQLSQIPEWFVRCAGGGEGSPDVSHVKWRLACGLSCADYTSVKPFKDAASEPVQLLVVLISTLEAGAHGT